jgi:hypothetical protein
MWHREITSKPFTLNFKFWNQESGQQPEAFHKVHSYDLQRTIDKNYFIIWLQDFGCKDGCTIKAGEQLIVVAFCEEPGLQF